jgi:hypothetical protein
MAAPPVLEHSSDERIIEFGPHVFRAFRMSATTAYFSISKLPVLDQASPYTMTLKIFFSRMYELRRMAGFLPVPLEGDDVATTPCEEEVLNLNIPSMELSEEGKVLHTMRKILGHVWMLRSLQLTAGEWDIIMPYDILHRLWYEASTTSSSSTCRRSKTIGTWLCWRMASAAYACTRCQSTQRCVSGDATIRTTGSAFSPGLIQTPAALSAATMCSPISTDARCICSVWTFVNLLGVFV